MTTRYSRFLSAFFCVFLGGLLAWHLLLPDRDRSDVENRTLAQLPEFSWESLEDGSFTKGVEEYFADQFPLRDQWTGLKARTEQVLGKREFNGVYLCGDALIAKVEPPKDGLEEKNLSYVSRLAERTELPVYLGLIPSAAEIRKDDLPKGAQSWDQAAFIARGLELEGVEPIDFLTALRDHAGERTWEGIFYRTDHHWTTLGAYYGYASLMESMGLEPVSLENLTPVTVTEDFNGTSFSSSGVRWLKPDSIQTYVPDDGLEVISYFTGKPEQGSLYVEENLAKKDKYSYFLGGNQPLCVIKTQNTDAPKLLLVRDSYSDSLAPFLTQNFSEIHLFDLRYNKNSLKNYVQQNGIDCAAALYSISNFVSSQDLFLLGM